MPFNSIDKEKNKKSSFFLLVTHPLGLIDSAKSDFLNVDIL